MRTLCFQLFLLGLLSLTCPVKGSTENLCRVNESRIMIMPVQRNDKGIAGGIKEFFNKHYQLLSKRATDNRGGKIAAIVLLALGVMLFGLFGFTILAVAIESWYFWGTAFALILVLVSLASLTLAILCVSGIIKTGRKLHRMKTGEPLQDEKYSPRPPSKKLNNKPE